MNVFLPSTAMSILRFRNVQIKLELERTLGSRKSDKRGKYRGEFADIVAWLQRKL